MSSPRDEYAQRYAHRGGDAERLAVLERRLSVARLAVFALALFAAWLAFDKALFSPWWLLLPVAVFVALLLAHDRVIHRRQRAARAAAFYASGLARLSDTWAGSGQAGERFLEDFHPYAADLDLFGRGSLFELLCTARTLAGEAVLASWLLAASPLAAIRARHAAVDELRPRLDLREDVALLGEDVRGALDPASLEAWAKRPAWQVSPLARAAAAILPALTLLTLAGWYFSLLGAWPFLLSGAVELAFASRLRPRVQAAVRAAEHPARDLALLSAMLARLEVEAFEAPRLRELREMLECEGEPPSRRIARLQRLIDLLDAYRNQLFAPIAAILLWRTNLALAIESWHATSGAAVTRWLAVTAEFEALSALASHAYEHPADPFPDFDESGTPLFDGEALGHPLIPESRCIRNDVQLGRGVRILIVSGSNMSGKSTLLRTVGVNAVLALAGAPVRARHLQLSPLAVGASIRIVDSLQNGTSRFYAEVKRLGRIVEMGRGTVPLLFLLDEILSGTNSHDRAIGAEAVVRRLADSGAVGLVTTHDLALARIADTLGAISANVHFEDHLEDGRMVFDYRMRPGVVQKSNALALMRAVGLEV